MDGSFNIFPVSVLESMLAYISSLFSLVYFSSVYLYFDSYNRPFVLFLLFFYNKCEIWWLYQSSTVIQQLFNFYGNRV